MGEFATGDAHANGDYIVGNSSAYKYTSKDILVFTCDFGVPHGAILNIGKCEHGISNKVVSPCYRQTNNLSRITTSHYRQSSEKN